MLLCENAITSLASEGYISLQIPHLDIVINDNKALAVPSSESRNAVELPDEWFVWLKVSKQPAVGKEQGYLYLTKIGWEANKEKIKSAFLKLPERERVGSWEDFERYAEKHFMEVQKAIKTKITRLQNKIKQLKEAQKKI